MDHRIERCTNLRKRHLSVGLRFESFKVIVTFSSTDDCTGRGRPRGLCVESVSSRVSTPRLMPGEPFAEFVPPSVPLSSDDEQDESEKTLPIPKKSVEKIARKKPNAVKQSTDHLPILNPPVVLPLKRDEKPTAVVLLPCLQFPDKCPSISELIVEFWRRYHPRRVSFSQQEIGFFSTADRADQARCREDYRYLKKLIYPLEQKKVHFDLNVGGEYLDTKVSHRRVHLSRCHSRLGTAGFARCNDVVDPSA